MKARKKLALLEQLQGASRSSSFRELHARAASGSFTAAGTCADGEVNGGDEQLRQQAGGHLHGSDGGHLHAARRLGQSCLSDIGHSTYASSTTVANLKQRLVAEWPQDKTVIPKSVNDMKLIHAGKVLENSKTLAESRILFGDLPGGVITMHVIVQPPLAKKKTGLRMGCLLHGPLGIAFTFYALVSFEE